MGIFDGYLFVTDLDGTLFDDKKQVSKQNLNAIDYFISQGGLFSFASGRGNIAGQILTKNIPKNAPAILFNGQMLYDFEDNQIIFKEELTSPRVKDYLKLVCEKFPYMCKVIFYGDIVFTTTDDEYTENMKRKLFMTGKKEEIDDVPLPWMKILCSGSPDDIEELQTFVKTLDFDDELQYVCSTPILMETMKKGVSKATALLQLSKYLNIDMKNTIAIGDYYNDKEMLQAAGHAFIPANGAADMKIIAEKVVASNNDGAIADVIDYMQKKEYYTPIKKI